MNIQNDSIILVDKPQGITSFGVVARIRHQLSQQLGKKAKVGHTGTLDPFATGLMIIVTGKMCKQASQYTKLDKTYQATFVLGKTSSTADVEGKLRRINSQQPSRTTIEAVMDCFLGEMWQTPPIFSAIKINGQRAYNLARQGKSFEIPRRRIMIYDLEIIDYNYPQLTIRVAVSSGTYVRSLAVDLGKMLGTGAYCQQLRRLSIADYNISQAQVL
ncbi:MAG: tRNA pseudouridine(55) synthase TruB [Candidatus Saccharibacteria bacterium]|nr:tRNA pseudouridine(55) synthase TruB [Candidatus Saccharibacteria bacterium]